ncbi:hypothetical protein DPMN_044564 [Dreissena polymorpha]|uniref:Uncharacterized protein n=1 Tax=Dreissena polymorpha TaxID=45954 RepID=A0A9D4HWK6_DREPO|nr:hypothetical protein DPMN_044564 [Dreissena polymorpha]
MFLRSIGLKSSTIVPLSTGIRQKLSVSRGKELEAVKRRFKPRKAIFCDGWLTDSSGVKKCQRAQKAK